MILLSFVINLNPIFQQKPYPTDIGRYKRLVGGTKECPLAAISLSQTVATVVKCVVIYVVC